MKLALIEPKTNTRVFVFIYKLLNSKFLCIINRTFLYILANEIAAAVSRYSCLEPLEPAKCYNPLICNLAYNLIGSGSGM